MDNELDGRLRRLETAMEAQHKVLDGHTVLLEQTEAAMKALVALLTRPEPSGPPMHELLGHLNAVIARANVLSEQILAAVEHLARGGRSG